MYIEPVYDLKIENNSYMVYVVFGIDEKGQTKVLSIETLKEKDFSHKYWLDIFIELKKV